MHIPVLQKEVLKYLAPRPNENFIDCTFGGGGHTFAILERNGPNGQVLGIDQDPEVLKNTRYKIQNTKYKNRLILVCDNFANLKEIIKREKFGPIQGILLDLGMSSWHLEESGRGFSFQKDEPLVMRYDWENQKSKIKYQKSKCNAKCKKKLTAAEIVNNWSEKEIEKILREYGEERFSRRIAREIVRMRKTAPIKRTFQLVEAIRKAIPSRYRKKGSRHFATRTFQALRIVVNDELENLKKVLAQGLEILEKGGRLVIISFHSLEDRLVKNFFKKQATKNQIKNLTKKPITSQASEILLNPRSRSAKLRAAQRT